MLRFTVQRIHETVRVPYEVIVVDDGSESRQLFDGVDAKVLRNEQPTGNCFSRDRGIEQARFDTVLILDAHMNFSSNDWSKRLLGYARQYPTDICCFICPQLAEDRPEMEKAKGVYYGAHILRRAEPKAMAVSPDGRIEYRQLLPCKWNRNKMLKAHVRSGGPVDVGCILGGAYGISREWYMDGLKRPWRYLRGWGTSEQNVAIPNYLLGGRNVLLPIVIGHMFRSGQHGKVPYRTVVAHMLYNNLRLAYLIMDDAERKREVDWALEPWRGHPVEDKAMALLESSNWLEYRQFLKGGPRSWAHYQKEWMSEGKLY